MKNKIVEIFILMFGLEKGYVCVICTHTDVCTHISTQTHIIVGL